MSATPFLDFYKSDLQAAFALWVVPGLFLLFLITRGRATGGGSDDTPPRTPEDAAFVRGYAFWFAIQTLADSFSTGPLSRWLGIADGPLGTVVMVFFVLLGDFRVYLLLFRLGSTAPLRTVAARAAAWTLVVPAIGVSGEALARMLSDDLPSQSIWLIYELAFLSVALFMLVRRDRLFGPTAEGDHGPFLADVLRYVALYYALWATADVIIMGLGADVGWGVRVIPNQLYYGFFVPFVFFRFRARS